MSERLSRWQPVLIVLALGILAGLVVLVEVNHRRQSQRLDRWERAFERQQGAFDLWQRQVVGSEGTGGR